jgi:hypothetical protein
LFGSVGSVEGFIGTSGVRAGGNSVAGGDSIGAIGVVDGTVVESGGVCGVVDGTAVASGRVCAAKQQCEGLIL